MASHPLQCQCGKVKGLINEPRSGNRVVCYCKDCQAFAHFLKREKDILDERGASDIVQISPKNLTFTQGAEFLACMRLTEKGLLRWYASCCNSPIGNTLATPKLSFIGLVLKGVTSDSRSFDDSFGPVRARVFTESAAGHPKPKTAGQGPMIFWFIGTVLKARFNGDYRKTPLFRADTGTPIVSPRVLSADERAKVMSAVRAASGG